MSRGWALGGDDFKAMLQAGEFLPEGSRAWDAEGARQLREAAWARVLTRALRAVRRREGEAGANRKSAPWKVAVAAHLKTTTQADNRWLAAKLHMGTPVAVSHHTGRLRQGHLPAAAQILAELQQNIKH
jgi:hypothetical protein